MILHLCKGESETNKTNGSGGPSSTFFSFWNWMQNKSFLNLVPCQKTKPLGTGGVFEQRDMHWKTEQYRPFLQLVLVFELFGFIPLMVYSIPLFLFKILTLPIYSIKYVNKLLQNSHLSPVQSSSNWFLETQSESRALDGPMEIGQAFDKFYKMKYI